MRLRSPSARPAALDLSLRLCPEEARALANDVRALLRNCEPGSLRSNLYARLLAHLERRLAAAERGA